MLGKKSDESLKLYIVYVVVVIPFHAWMDVRTACLIRKALELPAQKYFESTHSPRMQRFIENNVGKNVEKKIGKKCRIKMKMKKKKTMEV